MYVLPNDDFKALISDAEKLKAFYDDRNQRLELKADGSNSQLFFCIVSPAENKSFCRNYGGWIRNDINLFIDMENQKTAVEVLSRLQEIEQHGFSSDENPDLILKSLQSKYCQTPGEVTQWIEQQLEFRDIEAERVRLDKDDKLSAEQKALKLQQFKDSLNSHERDLWLTKKREALIDRAIDDELNEK